MVGIFVFTQLMLQYLVSSTMLRMILSGGLRCLGPVLPPGVRHGQTLDDSKLSECVLFKESVGLKLKSFCEVLDSFKQNCQFCKTNKQPTSTKGKKWQFYQF